MQLLPTQPAPSPIAAGAATNDSSDESESFSILFSSSSDKQKEPKSSPVSLPLPLQITYNSWPWTHVPFVPPSTVWLRPSGLTNLRSPIHDAAGRLDPLLALQLKKYADDDPGPTPQQAVPLEVIRKVQILDEKRDGRRNRPTRGCRILFRDAVVRVLRRGQRKAVNSGQNGRRPFPEKNGETLTTTGPRSRARRRHCHYHVQEAEEWRQRSDGDATLKRQLGTVGHLSRSSHDRPGNESTKLRTPRTDEPENQFDRDDKPGRKLSHSLQDDPHPTPSCNNLDRRGAARTPRRLHWHPFDKIRRSNCDAPRLSPKRDKTTGRQVEKPNIYEVSPHPSPRLDSWVSRAYDESTDVLHDRTRQTCWTNDNLKMAETRSTHNNATGPSTTTIAPGERDKTIRTRFRCHLFVLTRNIQF